MQDICNTGFCTCFFFFNYSPRLNVPLVALYYLWSEFGVDRIPVHLPFLAEGSSFRISIFYSYCHTSWCCLHYLSILFDCILCRLHGVADKCLVSFSVF